MLTTHRSETLARSTVLCPGSTDKPRGPLIVILDEADQVEEQPVFYELYQNLYVTILLIANDDEEFIAPLKQGANSDW